MMETAQVTEVVQGEDQRPDAPIDTYLTPEIEETISPGLEDLLEVETENSLFRIEASLLEEGENLPEGLELAYRLNVSSKSVDELLAAETALEKGVEEKAEDLKIEGELRDAPALDDKDEIDDEASMDSSRRYLDDLEEITLSEMAFPPREAFGPHAFTSGSSGSAPLPQLQMEALPDMEPGKKQEKSSDAAAANAEGKSKLAEGNVTEAIASLEKAVVLEPFNPEYREDLASAAGQAA